MRDYFLARARAITRLQSFGVEIHSKASTAEVVAAIEAQTGMKCRPKETTSFMQYYAEPRKALPPAPKFTPMKVRQHPRLAEIERAQPPLITPTGTGNYNQYSKFMLDNGNKR